MVLIVAVLISTGCATKKTIVVSESKKGLLPIPVEIVKGFQWPDENLPMRFQQYWTYRKAGDAVAAFEFEAPHVREMVIWGRYEKFSKTVRTDWLSVRVEKINRITDQLIEIDFNMVAKRKDREGVTRDAFFRDSWLLFSGQWFHVLKDPLVTGDGIGK